MPQLEMPFSNLYQQSLDVYQCRTSPTIHPAIRHFSVLLLSVALYLPGHRHIDLSLL